MNKQDILNAYSFRHACKVYDPSKKISDEDLRFILETGRQSPTSFGLEPMQLVVVKNEEMLKFIGENCWGVGTKATDASDLVLILARKGKTLQEGTAHFTKMFREIKGVDDTIFNAYTNFFKQFRTSDFDLNTERAFDDWAARQTFIALGNMMTSAAMIGIDSTALEGFPMEKMSTYLAEKGVLNREEFNLVAMAAFGYRLEDPKRPQTRRPFDEVVSFVR
ncbi:hypothetical protein A1D22_04925 [Pasteurellaceae bacterium LFhippo2]|nr:hypothetical protein [Pasteurellaceae bacterium LFhippo2]